MTRIRKSACYSKNTRVTACVRTWAPARASITCLWIRRLNMNIATMKTFITSAWGKWVILLSVFLALGATAGLYILTQGLAATNLTDLVPWGLWIAIDL